MTEKLIILITICLLTFACTKDEAVKKRNTFLAENTTTKTVSEASSIYFENNTCKIYSKYELCKLINKVYNLNIKVNKLSAKTIEGTKINNVLDRSLNSNKQYFNLINNDFEKQLIDIKLWKI